VLFGLGLIMVTVQLAARLACSELGQVSVQGVTLSDVCITLPVVSGEHPSSAPAPPRRARCACD
jgi:hypothetical protein